MSNISSLYADVGFGGNWAMDVCFNERSSEPEPGQIVGATMTLPYRDEGKPHTKTWIQGVLGLPKRLIFGHIHDECSFSTSFSDSRNVKSSPSKASFTYSDISYFPSELWYAHSKSPLMTSWKTALISSSLIELTSGKASMSLILRSM